MPQMTRVRVTLPVCVRPSLPLFFLASTVPFCLCCLISPLNPLPLPTSSQSGGLSWILSRAHFLTLAFSLARALWLAIGVTTGILTGDHLSSGALSCVVFHDLRDTEEVLAALGVSP
jgi:hypothetical protein